jgi:hypothetical protein
MERDATILLHNGLGGPCLSPLDVIRETLGEPVEHEPHPRRGPQVAVYDQPHFERKLKNIGQDGDEVGGAASDGVLAAADPDAGAQRSELGEIAVAAKAEILAG